MTATRCGSNISEKTLIKLSTKFQDKDPECPVLIRSLDLPQRVKFLSTDIDLRRLVIGKVGGVEMLDFWNTAT